MDPLQQLELIDDLQRLGISYHFDDEIKQILTEIDGNKCSKNIDHDEQKIKDLYATALEFRLLRQHGFNVSQEIFDCFKNEKGEFKPNLCDDPKGLLQLYEASFLGKEGETVLEMARKFTVKHLKDQRCFESDFPQMVHQALELPLHWTVSRAQASWFISMYEKREDRNPVILELSKLDFNFVQATFQQELKHVSRWWKRTCLAEKLPFARDRLVESFFWTIGGRFEPQYAFFRTTLTKVNILITIIDDVYDVYGTLDELELFTTIVERWDVDSIHQLPYYMQICFLALNNFVNETAYDVLKETGVITIPYLRKSWIDLCKAYLKEAKWSFSDYSPTMEEYMDNAWISISANVILSHSFFCVTNPLKDEDVERLMNYPQVIRWSATILRLADDLATSTDEAKRGDVSKSIQCYMNDTGVLEDEARKHIKIMIDETWKKLNKDGSADCFSFPRTFTETVVNLARMAQYVYQYGDGHGMQNSETKDRILALLFKPITMQAGPIMGQGKTRQPPQAQD